MPETETLVTELWETREGLKTLIGRTNELFGHTEKDDPKRIKILKSDIPDSVLGDKIYNAFKAALDEGWVAPDLDKLDVAIMEYLVVERELTALVNAETPATDEEEDPAQPEDATAEEEELEETEEDFGVQAKLDAITPDTTPEEPTEVAPVVEVMATEPTEEDTPQDIVSRALDMNGLGEIVAMVERHATAFLTEFRSMVVSGNGSSPASQKPLFSKDAEHPPSDIGAVANAAKVEARAWIVEQKTQKALKTLIEEKGWPCKAKSQQAIKACITKNWANDAVAAYVSSLD